jgi:CRP/FNR family cyclic AMP-dependent transcriptional regulator
MPTQFNTRKIEMYRDCEQVTRVYPPGHQLFAEGHTPEGVYLLGTGRVKLYSTATQGKVFITKIARPGELLGLNAAVLGKAYLVSAEVIEPSRINFIASTVFLRFLDRSPRAASDAIHQLSANYYDAQRDLGALALSQSAREKLAKLLLEWVEHAGGPTDAGDIWLRVYLTHEEIAQMIGASRETVTRMFGDLTRRKVIEGRGEALRVRDLAALRRIARM